MVAKRVPERWYVQADGVDVPTEIMIAVAQLQHAAMMDDRYLGEIEIDYLVGQRVATREVLDGADPSGQIAHCMAYPNAA